MAYLSLIRLDFPKSPVILTKKVTIKANTINTKIKAKTVDKNTNKTNKNNGMRIENSILFLKDKRTFRFKNIKIATITKT